MWLVSFLTSCVTFIVLPNVPRFEAVNDTPLE